MKNIFIYIMILLATTFTACFENSGSELKLTLTNTSSSEILHVAVLEDEAILENKSFSESAGEATITVPSGKKLTFVIVGTNASNKVVVFGSKIVEINDDMKLVSIDLIDADWTGSGPLSYNYDGSSPNLRVYWTSTNIVNTIYHAEIADPYELLYHGTDTEMYLDGIWGCDFYVEFYPFGLKTGIMSFGWG